MNPESSVRRSKSSSLAVVAVIVVAIFVASFLLSTWSCLAANAEGAICFASLRPVMAQLIAWHYFPRDHYLEFYNYVFSGIVGAVSFVALVSLVRRKWTSLGVCLAVVLASAGEYLVLEKRPYEGVVVTLAAIALVAVIGFFFPKNSTERESYRTSITAGEGAAFLLFAALLFCTQFYYLNRIPMGWDTEFCPFRFYFWPTWSGLLLHESGFSPQTSAGLSWNFVMKLLGHQDEPDDYYLYIRLLSSGVAALKFLLTFFFVRYLCGTFAAFLSIALLGFGPPENWWSREAYLHQLPGLVAIVFMWLFVRTWRAPTWLNFLALSFMTGIMRFLYPSGMFLAFAPLSFFALLVLFRWGEWKRNIPKMMTLSLGLGFWASWRTIARGLQRGDWTWVPPLDIPFHFAPPTIMERLHTLLLNGVDTFNSIFVYQVHPTHWTVALTLPPERVTTSIVVVLLVLALGRLIRFGTGQLGLLLFVCLFWTLLPGMMTDVAARRMGVAFVVLIIIASREADYLTKLLMSNGNAWVSRVVRFVSPALACGYLGWIGSAEHFRGGYSIPPQIVRGQMFREELKDNSLVVFLSDQPCDTFFSMYQELQDRSCSIGWVTPDYEGSPDTQSLIEDPKIRPNTWAYEYSKLNKCVEEQKSRSWERVFFFIREGPLAQDHIKRVQSQYPQASLKEKKRGDGGNSEYRVWVFEVPAEQLAKGRLEPSQAIAGVR